MSTVRHGASAPTGQFGLLRQRRFGPFFVTQFLGAANDNLFKFALTVLVTYQLQLDWLPPDMAGLVIGSLFILPFVLLSATAGQWADKHDKAWIMLRVKQLELGIMVLATVGFALHAVPVLLACIFLMGLHSTLFGPAKYAYLPQHLDERELTGGNGMVEMGTFVAILLGNVAGGLLMAVPGVGSMWVSVACLSLAALGWWTAARVPASPSAAPDLVVNWNPLSETWRNLMLAREEPSVLRSLIGISWMWFFGAVFLAQFPSFARGVLGGDEHVASLLLVVFSVGIAVGSLCCESWSHRHVEIGLVPIGALGMTVFGLDLFASTRGLSHAPDAALLTVREFVREPVHLRVMVDLALMAFSTGLYSVPMYALIQLRSRPERRARIIAANNILNALFMIVSSLLAGVLLGAGWRVPDVFGATAALNLLVVGAVFWFMPEYPRRLGLLVLQRWVYRPQDGAANEVVSLPQDGPAIALARKWTRADAVALAHGHPRPTAWVTTCQGDGDAGIGALRWPLVVIELALDADERVAARALAQAQAVLDAGGVLCGVASATGHPPWVGALLKTHAVPVCGGGAHPSPEA